LIVIKKRTIGIIYNEDEPEAIVLKIDLGKIEICPADSLTVDRSAFNNNFNE
jgi:hypothetical protein